MPTYEYACTACGHRLEAVQKFTDDPLTECPECGGALRKVYGAVGIVLKGSGFYKTDSRAAVGEQRLREEGRRHPERDSSGGDSTPKKESSASDKSSSDKEQLGQGQLGQGRLRQGQLGQGRSGNGSSGKQTAPASSTAG